MIKIYLKKVQLNYLNVTNLLLFLKKKFEISKENKTKDKVFINDINVIRDSIL